MKKIVLPTILALFVFITLNSYSLANTECNQQASNSDCSAEKVGDSAGKQTTDADEVQLPAAELEKVKEHHVKLRYFKAIGFLKKSDAERDAISTIFAQHNLSVPEEYQK